ncbi:unnamed protein product [Closterium sp. NIES-65]|nr:unnamed protein product [Closterium sp. NIES-65]
MRLIFFSFFRLRVIMGHHSSERGGNGVRVSRCLDALHGSPKRISLQQILDCRNATSSSCAAGGWLTTALDYMVDATLTWGGLASESGYAYTQKDGKSVKACSKLCSSFLFSLQHSFPPLFLHLSLPPLSLHLSLFPLSLHLSLFPLSLHLFLFPLSLHLFFFPLSLYLSPSPSPVHASLPPSSPGHMQRRRVCSGGGGGSQCGGDGVQLNVIGRHLLDPPQLLGGHVGHAVDVCSQQDENPCAVGTCINDKAGGFFCLCPPGFDQGYRPNGAHTCVPTYNPSYTVIFPIDISCPLVYQLYGLTEEAFLAQNPNLGMGPCKSIPANMAVSVAPPLKGAVYWHGPVRNHPCQHGSEHGTTLKGAVYCALYYSWTENDTFESVADSFWLTVDDFLTLNPGINCTDCTAWNALSVNKQVRCGALKCTAVLGGLADLFWLAVDDFLTLNPGINCTDYTAWNTPTMNQQLCVAKGSGGGDVPTLPMCTTWYTVHSGDTCESIMKDFALNQTTFFSLNPGVGCDSLFASVGGSSLGWSGGGVQVREWQQVCVDAYLVETSGSPTPRSLRELFSTSPLVPSTPSLSFQSSSSSSSFSSSSSSPLSLSTRGLLIPSPSAQPMRGRQLAVSKKRCLAFYSVTRGEFCARIISLKFQNTSPTLPLRLPPRFHSAFPHASTPPSPTLPLRLPPRFHSAFPSASTPRPRASLSVTHCFTPLPPL